MLIRNIRSRDAHFIVNILHRYGEDVIQGALDYKDYKKALHVRLTIYTLLVKVFLILKLYKILSGMYIDYVSEMCKVEFLLQDMDSIRKVFKG